MKCFYHDDLDGRAAAFCVYAWVGIKDHSFDSEFYSINYDKQFPLDSIKPDEQVWIVDYSIEPDEMRALLEITKDVTWIDHHKTAIEKYKDFEHDIKGVRRDGEAGCVLTYKYIHWWSNRGEEPFDFFNMDRPKTYPIPRMIELVGDRDIWAWKYGDETKFFFAGSQLHDTKPGSSFWWKCIDHELDPDVCAGNKEGKEKGKIFWNQLLRDGETIEKYKEQSDKGLNNDLGFECNFEGHKCWSINRPRVSSDRLGGRIKEYDIVMPFHYNGERFIVSMYSEKVDVSEIAKKYGGGGHKGAAGFHIKELPF